MIDQSELGLLKLANATQEDIELNDQLLKRTGNKLGRMPLVVTWFLPFVDHALKGGVRTVFMLAQHLSQQFGTTNHFVIVGYGSEFPKTQNLAKSLTDNFPELNFTIQPYRTLFDNPKSLPPSECGICTLWTTAYVLLRYQKTLTKFYLVQDFEPNFYPAGTVSGIIEQTYRFGFAVLANTRGVAVPVGRYTNDVTQFYPGVDQEIFYPDETRDTPQKPFRIVFYGRPGNQRNCFLLGIETLRAVKCKLGDDVDILSVGAAWDEKEANVDGIIRNLGLLSTMEEVAQLYRESDLGLVFMMTPHPSYQPFEYMASGCLVATNKNESTSWLLNAQNALILTPLPEVASGQIIETLSDPYGWQEKRSRATQEISQFDWSDALDAVASRLIQ